MANYEFWKTLGLRNKTLKNRKNTFFILGSSKKRGETLWEGYTHDNRHFECSEPRGILNGICTFVAKTKKIFFSKIFYVSNFNQYMYHCKYRIF